MRKITLQQFCDQWTPAVKGVNMEMTSRLQFNVLEFTTAASKVSREFFQKSFSYGGFYGSGSKWASRSSGWGRKFTHPILFDSGRLRDNISGKRSSERTGHIFNKRGKTGNKYLKVEDTISTNESSFPEKGKRGRRRKGSSLRYAAIHNSDPQKTNYTVNQYSSNKPVRRQFIGRSIALDAEVARLIPMIFKGFPND